MAAPILTYVTIFRSRLGGLNLVLQLSGFGNKSTAMLDRSIKKVLGATTEVQADDPDYPALSDYLRAKKRLPPRGEGGPDPILRIQQQDRWLSDPRIPSTIGAPTVENAGELIEFAQQFRVVVRATNAWTAAGQLIVSLRQMGDGGTNPYLLAREAPALLRQFVNVDGPMIQALAEYLSSQHGSITRDSVATGFPSIVELAVDRSRTLRLAPPDLREVLAFRKVIRDQGSSSRPRVRSIPIRSRASSARRAPGVLEHRTTPRLEWLVDLGYLSKSGLPRNGFTYQPTESLVRLRNSLAATPADATWAEEIAVREWHAHPDWARSRDEMARGGLSEAFRAAYGMLRRPIGPAPLKEVVFATALGDRDARGYAATFEWVVEHARSTPGLTLSRGRYSREPTSIFVQDPEALA
jgi:hypothetical protein